MKRKPKITPENKAITPPENKAGGRQIGALSPWDARIAKPPATKKKMALSPWDTSRPKKKPTKKGAEAKPAKKR